MIVDVFGSSRPWMTLSMTIAAAVAAGCGTAGPGDGGRPGVDPPTFSAQAGEVAGSVLVTISSPAEGAEIHYELELGMPVTTSSPRYSGPVVLTPRALYEESMAMVRAIAILDRVVSKEVAATYRLPVPPDPTPTFSPAGGTFTSSRLVTITSSVQAATIWYTIDGSEPRWGASPIYSGPIVVDRSTTVRAIATLYNDETPVASATYQF